MSLLKMIRERKLRRNTAVLVYGDAKKGKTHLVATAAELPNIKRVFWFDLENGSETLENMGLSDEALDKIILFKIPDTKKLPRACETVLKAFTSEEPISVCITHGKVACKICAKEDTQEFDIGSLTSEDLVVVDSGSQLSDSALRMAMLGRPVESKPEWDDYTKQCAWLGDILSTMQAATNTRRI